MEIGSVKLTDAEKEVLDLLSTAVYKYMDLPEAHESHRRDFADAIHTCQRLLGQRVAYRADPDIWAGADVLLHVMAEPDEMHDPEVLYNGEQTGPSADPRSADA